MSFEKTCPLIEFCGDCGVVSAVTLPSLVILMQNSDFLLGFKSGFGSSQQRNNRVNGAGYRVLTWDFSCAVFINSPHIVPCVIP